MMNDYSNYTYDELLEVLKTGVLSKEEKQTVYNRYNELWAVEFQKLYADTARIRTEQAMAE